MAPSAYRIGCNDEIGGDGVWYDLDYGKGFGPNIAIPISCFATEALLPPWLATITMISIAMVALAA